MEQQPENVEVKKIEENKPKKKRNPPKTCPLKNSTFFLTINTNENMNGKTKEQSEEFYNKSEHIIDDFFRNLQNFMIFTHATYAETYGFVPTNNIEELLTRLIATPRCDYVIETGPETGKLHCHCLMHFRKRGLNVKLDLPKIRTHFAKEFGHQVYINYQLHNSASANLELYLQKNPTR